MLAFGVLGKSNASFGVNNNARAFLHPPGVHKDNTDALSITSSSEFSYIPPPAYKNTRSQETKSDEDGMYNYTAGRR